MRGGFAMPTARGKGINLQPIPKAGSKGKEVAKDIGKVLSKSKLNTKDLRQVLKLALLVSDTALSSKLGPGTFFKLARSSNSLLGANPPMVHTNKYTNTRKGQIKETTLHVGKPIEGRFKVIPSFHYVNRVSLADTEMDCNDPKKKKELVSSCGFNQRNVIFLDNDPYLSVSNLQRITDAKKHIKEVVEERVKTQKPRKVEKTRSKWARRKTNVSLHSLVHNIKSTYKIRNLMPEFNVSLIIHVCCMKDTTECQLGPTEVRKAIILEALDKKNLQSSLRDDQILTNNEIKEDKEVYFKEELKLSIDSVIKKSTVFRDNINCLNTITRRLKPGDRLDFNLIEHFREGINLNKLTKNKNNEELPSTLFLIIETLGDPRATLRDKQHDLLYNGYSPTKIGFDMRMDISYVAWNKDRDNPIVIRKEEARLDYDDEDLGEEYYPSREQKFNVDLSNIQIGGNLNKKTRYELILEDQSEVIPMLSEIKTKDDNEVLTEDDVRLNIDVEDNQSQTKSVKERLNELPPEEIERIYNDPDRGIEDDFLDLDLDLDDIDEEQSDE